MIRGETMKSTRRALFLLAAVLAISALFAPPAAAQKGTGLLPAGIYRFDFTGADFSGSSNNISIFLNACSGTDVARPDGGARRPPSGRQIPRYRSDNTPLPF